MKTYAKVGNCLISPIFRDPYVMFLTSPIVMNKIVLPELQFPTTKLLYNPIPRLSCEQQELPFFDINCLISL